MQARAISVVCLNHNDYLGMGDHYVDRLHSMVNRHLTIPYEFVELTERDIPDSEGWWAKLDMLHMFDGDCLYFDLDVVITANIDHLVRIGRADISKLWARNDFSYPVSPNARLVGDGFAGPLMENGREATINSSVMFWSGRWNVGRRDGVHGDQGCITAALWPDRIGLFPNDWIKSYRYHKGEMAPVVVLHGSPKNHELPATDPIMAHWR